MCEIVIHGGAGDRIGGASPSETQLVLETAKHALRAICAAGQARLERGDSAEDVVQWAVERLEDFPLFNAGCGAAPDENGHIRMDACFVSGEGRTGGCALVSRVRNPVRLARAIADHPGWTGQLIAGASATLACAQRLGVPRAPRGHFRSRLARRVRGVHRSLGSTVGAVARDRAGRLAAASSTGGLEGRRRGRVGDTPVANLSTFAENGVGAVALTGCGEVLRARGTMLRMVRHWGAGTGVAARRALEQTGAGQAGLIALGPARGDWFVGATTERMFWARAAGGELEAGVRRGGPAAYSHHP